MYLLDLCGNGGDFYNGHCYRKTQQCQRFDIAGDKCQEEGAILPVINSEEESLFIQERIQSATWLNLYKTSQSRSSHNQWNWRNGEPLNFTKWFPGQPEDLRDQSCAVVDNQGIDSGWTVEHCSACRSTVCKKGTQL